MAAARRRRRARPYSTATRTLAGIPARARAAAARARQMPTARAPTSRRFCNPNAPTAVLVTRPIISSAATAAGERVVLGHSPRCDERALPSYHTPLLSLPRPPDDTFRIAGVVIAGVVSLTLFIVLTSVYAPCCKGCYNSCRCCCCCCAKCAPAGWQKHGPIHHQAAPASVTIVHAPAAVGAPHYHHPQFAFAATPLPFAVPQAQYSRIALPQYGAKLPPPPQQQLLLPPGWTQHADDSGAVYFSGPGGVSQWTRP